jgi:glucokinase
MKTSRSHRILAGDVGGTKTRLGLFLASSNNVLLKRSRTVSSRAFQSLEGIIGEFLAEDETISAACFGVAGPIVSGSAIATNLPWNVSVRSLRRRLSIESVFLVNDLVANAYGVDVMERRDFTTLNRGRKVIGNRALLSAGTGLGAAVMFWDGRHHVPSPSEGGHVEFGPRNRLELGLLRYLFERFGHVSYERVLSGAGLFHIYQFLRDTGKYGREPGWLGTRFKKEDPASVIAEAARLKKCRVCGAALDLFVSIYGAAAGNLALQVMASGGIFIGGGIAPKVIWKLREGSFIEAFKDKGRLTPLVQSIPVKVIMNDQAALLGAAAYAARQLKK